MHFPGAGVRPPGAPVRRRIVPAVHGPHDGGLPGRRRDLRPRREPLRAGGPGGPGAAPGAGAPAVDRPRSRSRSTPRTAGTPTTSTSPTSAAPAPPRGDRALGETDYQIHVVRSTDHGRTFSPPAVITGPEGSTTSMPDLAVGPDGAVYATFRSSPVNGQRPVWIARSTDGGATFSPAQLVARFTSFDSRQFALTGVDTPQCGDGPFACPSGFSFPHFCELRAGHGRPQRRARHLEPGAGERPEQDVRPHLARRGHVDRAAGAARRRADRDTSGPPTSRRRAASSRRCSPTRATTRPLRPTGRRATRPKARTPGRRFTPTSPARATAGARGRSGGSAGSPATPTTRPTSRRGCPGTAPAKLGVRGARCRRPRRLDRLTRRGGRRRRAARQPRERLRRPRPVRLDPEHGRRIDPSATRRPRLRTRASTKAGSISTSMARGSAAVAGGTTRRRARLREGSAGGRAGRPR